MENNSKTAILNKCVVYTYANMGKLRTMVINDKGLCFCLSDLCRFLNISEKQIGQQLGAEKIFKYTVLGGAGNAYMTTFITEDTMSEMLLNSSNPSAEHIYNWIVDHVLIPFNTDKQGTDHDVACLNMQSTDNSYPISYFSFPHHGSFRAIVIGNDLLWSTEDVIKVDPTRLQKILSGKENNDITVRSINAYDPYIGQTIGLAVIDNIDMHILLKYLDPFKRYALSNWMMNVVYKLIDMDFAQLSSVDISIHMRHNPLYALQIGEFLVQLKRNNDSKY